MPDESLFSAEDAARALRARPERSADAPAAAHTLSRWVIGDLVVDQVTRQNGKVIYARTINVVSRDDSEPSR
jgi:hypothetical protein